MSLRTLAEQASSGALREVLSAMDGDVSSGLSFSQALQRHSDVFPPTYAHLIRAAEEGGFLPAALDRLREMDEKREELRSALVSALSYPVFLTGFSIAVVIFVLVVVFPKFSEMFKMIHDQLPVTTRFLMATSDILREWWLPGCAVAVVASALAWRSARKPEGREFLDRVAISLPLVRNLVIQLNMVQLLRVLGLSLGNGVNILDALGSARATLRSLYFQRFVDTLVTEVSEGRGIASGFNADERIPLLVRQMISTAEETGNLAIVMERLADFYERQWRKAMAVASKMAEPVLLIVMGAVVGLIVSSLILPIFKLSRAVH